MSRLERSTRSSQKLQVGRRNVSFSSLLCVFHMASAGRGYMEVEVSIGKCTPLYPLFLKWETYLKMALLRNVCYAMYVKSVKVPFAFHMMTLELLKKIPCRGFGWPFKSHFAPMLTSFHKRLRHHSYFLLLLSKPLVYALKLTDESRVQRYLKSKSDWKTLVVFCNSVLLKSDSNKKLLLGLLTSMRHDCCNPDVHVDFTEKW